MRTIDSANPICSVKLIFLKKWGIASIATAINPQVQSANSMENLVNGNLRASPSIGK